VSAGAGAAPPTARRRWRRSIGVSLAAALSTSALAASSAAAESRPPTGAVDAVAVASEQLSYEAGLIDLVLPRLTGAAAAAAIRVRAMAASLDPTLSADIRRWGVAPSSAAHLWDSRIGDGAPPPDEAQYSCSVRAQQTNAEDLATTPVTALAGELGTIELTLLLEGRQLAADLTAIPRLAAALDQNQRDALHLLVPLLLPTDRSFAASA
jgi:hypothetical protein